MRHLFALTLILGLVTGPPNSSHSIVIRHDLDRALYSAEGKQYPSVVTFLWPREEGEEKIASLSGTLIAHHWILSAAHGREEFEQETLRIEVGGITYEEVPFNLWLPHPCFPDQAEESDIGLVYVPNPPWPELASYPDLYEGRDELGMVLVFVGRGNSGDGRKGSAGEEPKSLFLNATNKVDYVDERLIGFTFEDPELSESTVLEGISGDGDSGGPAFMCEELSLDPLGRITCLGALKLLGVSSFQEELRPGSTIGVYGVKERYTRVSTHREWIETTMLRSEAGSCTEAQVKEEVIEGGLASGCQGGDSPLRAWHSLFALLLIWTGRRSGAVERCR